MSDVKLKDIMNSNVIAVPYGFNFFETVAMMRDKKISCVVITEEERPVGILTERDAVRIILNKNFGSNTTVEELMSKPVKSVNPEIDVAEAYNILLVNKIRHLIVINDEEDISGVITLSDIIDHLGMEYFVHVKDIDGIMTSDVITRKKDDSLQDILTLMNDNHISCVVIEEDNNPIGIFTERDLIHIFNDNINLEEHVQGFMSQPVITIGREEPLFMAVLAMAREKVRRLVVTDEKGKIAGIVSQVDLIKGVESKYCTVLREIITMRETELNDAYNELALREEKYRVLVDNASDAIVVVQDDHLKFHNPKTIEITGYSNEELGQKPIVDLIHPDDKEMVLNYYSNRKSDKDAQSYSLRIIDKSGETKWLESKPIMINWEGKPAYLTLLRDITRRKKTDEQLAEQLIELKRWEKMTVGRELRMKEIKEENQKLRDKNARLKG